MKAFIDLGSHRGKTIRMFMKSKQWDPSFRIHAFEASPLLGERVFTEYPRGVTIHKSAAWTCSGILDFYICPQNPLSQGPSLFKEKKTGHLDRAHPIKVKCFNFSSWIRSTFQPDDHIVVKCNIEGAEYPVFNKMLEDGTMKYIKKLYLHVHWHKIGMPKEENDRFIERIKAAGVELHTEYKYRF